MVHLMIICLKYLCLFSFLIFSSEIITIKSISSLPKSTGDFLSASCSLGLKNSICHFNIHAF